MARGRRPTELVKTEILQAAGELLLEAGMAGFTIEKVAARAGASRMTVYKWWPSKGALALDGYFSTVEQTLAFPDTGDVWADLRSQLHAFVDLLTTTSAGRIVKELVGAAQTDPDLMAAYTERYSKPRRRLAVERMTGCLRDGVDPAVLVDQLWGACYHRLLVPDLDVTTDFADALLDVVRRGAQR